MFKRIKSQYFMKLLFYNIKERNKLKLIKYNKNLQKIFEVNLIKYKILSGRYIIYEKNNKGKEYNSYNDILLFEGEYLNGKRNGKGKEYNDYGEIIFEGEYLNGKKWNGKGKEYDDYGYLIFEGEYLNGKRNGKGEEYNDYGYFEGEYINGKEWNGRGYDWDKNCIYELKEGKGLIKEYNDYGEIIFVGEYLNGERNGKLKEYDNFDFYLKFEGEFLNGKRNGNGKEYYGNDKLKFEGE